MNAQSVKWNRERHKPFKGHSKAKATKKGRLEKELHQKTPLKKALSKPDRKNASKVGQKQKRIALAEERQLNSSIRPIVTLIEITENINSSTFNLSKDIIVQHFAHGSSIAKILDATRMSDVLLLVAAPKIPTDEWSENAQFAIRSQGMPSSVALLIPDEGIIDPTVIKNEWASYLSDRYSVLSVERKNNIFTAVSQIPQLETFIFNSERRAISKAVTRNSNSFFPSLIVESSSFSSSDHSVTFTGTLRGDRMFNEIDAIIIPGIVTPFKKWSIALTTMDIDGDISIKSKDIGICNCNKGTVDGLQPFSQDLKIAKNYPTSRHDKNKHLEEGISEYQSAWIINDETSSELDENDTCEMDVDDFDNNKIDQKSSFPNDGKNAFHSVVSVANDEKDSIDIKTPTDDMYDSEGSDDIISIPENVLAKHFLSEYRPIGFFANQKYTKSDHKKSQKALSIESSFFVSSFSLTLFSLPEDMNEDQFTSISFLYGLPLNLCECCNKLTKRPVKLVFSVNLTSTYESNVGGVDQLPPENLVIQIGPWRSSVKIKFGTEHKYFNGSSSYLHHRLIRLLPKFKQSLYGHIDCPGIDLSLPLFIPSSTPVFIYGSNEIPIATGKIISNSFVPLLQRATLIGYPYKIHQKSAVIRGMFHTAEDVEFFSPVEIIAMNSSQKGYIRESLGTHGLMKATFNRPIAKQEPICMHLFKKIY